MFKHRIYWLALSTLFLQSCATSHDRFVEVMNFHIDNKYTHSRIIKESGHQWANPDFLYNKEQVDSEITIYHYAHPNIFKRFCHYYFEVNNESNLVVGWGFDPDKSDPAKNCGISGGF